MPELEDELTRWLRSWSDGDPEGLDRVVSVVIDDLRRLARHHLNRVGSTPTLQPTMIVHEAYLRLARHQTAVFPSRQHFFAFASKLIRDFLVDHLRRRAAAKRGDGLDAVTLTTESIAAEPPLPTATVLEIHDLLLTLERRDPRRAQVVELRYFAGLTMAEISGVTGRSLATTERDWQVARRWLARELGRP